MFVPQVVSPGSRHRSWTVLGPDGVPVEPVERYLAFLTDVDRSPNTVKAYAHDLKDWFVFLTGRGLDWREVRLEDVGEFVAWLRLPPPARDGRVAVLPSVTAHCGAATVNRKLSAVSAFYQHATRHGVDLGELLASWQPAGRRGTSWRPFLHHISKSQPAARRVIGLKVPRKHPRILNAVEMQASSTPAIGCGTGCCSRCCTTPGCGSGRRWGCGTRTGPQRSARSRWWRGSTTTVPAPSPGSRARSRPARVGPALRRLPARRVRRPGQRLRVRQPLGRPGNVAIR